MKIITAPSVQLMALVAVILMLTEQPWPFWAAWAVLMVAAVVQGARRDA